MDSDKKCIKCAKFIPFKVGNYYYYNPSKGMNLCIPCFGQLVASTKFNSHGWEEQVFKDSDNEEHECSDDC